MRSTTSRPNGSTPARTAGWSRCPVTWPAASSRRWPLGRRWSETSLAGEVGRQNRTIVRRLERKNATPPLQPPDSIGNFAEMTYSAGRVLFQAVKHALYDRLLSRSTAVLSLRSKHRSGNVPFILVLKELPTMATGTVKWFNDAKRF